MERIIVGVIMIAFVLVLQIQAIRVYFREEKKASTAQYVYIQGILLLMWTIVVGGATLKAIFRYIHMYIMEKNIGQSPQ